MLAAIAMGIVAAAARRSWPALTLLPLPLALTALYAVFFAEARYHLAIVMLLLPFAGGRSGLGGDLRARSHPGTQASSAAWQPRRWSRSLRWG